MISAEASVRTWWSARPVAAQLDGQLLRPLLWEEELAPVDLDDLPRTGDQVAQAVRPLHPERFFRGAPDQQHRHIETAQPTGHRRELGGVQGRENPLEQPGPLDSP